MKPLHDIEWKARSEMSSHTSKYQDGTWFKFTNLTPNFDPFEIPAKVWQQLRKEYHNV